MFLLEFYKGLNKNSGEVKEHSYIEIGEACPSLFLTSFIPSRFKTPKQNAIGLQAYTVINPPTGAEIS